MSDANQAVIELDVTGMTCNHCVQAVTKAVQATPGAAEADIAVDLDSGRVTVGGGSPDRAALVAAIADAGYQAS